MKMRVIKSSSHDHPSYQNKEQERVDAELKGAIKVDTYSYERPGYGAQSWELVMFAFFPDDED